MHRHKWKVTLKYGINCWRHEHSAPSIEHTDENRYKQPIYDEHNLMLFQLLFIFPRNSMDTKSSCTSSKKSSTTRPNMSSCLLWLWLWLCLGIKAKKIEIIVWAHSVSRCDFWHLSAKNGVCFERLTRQNSIFIVEFYTIALLIVYRRLKMRQNEILKKPIRFALES